MSNTFKDLGRDDKGWQEHITRTLNQFRYGLAPKHLWKEVDDHIEKLFSPETKEDKEG